MDFGIVGSSTFRSRIYKFASNALRQRKISKQQALMCLEEPELMRVVPTEVRCSDVHYCWIDPVLLEPFGGYESKRTNIAWHKALRHTWETCEIIMETGLGPLAGGRTRIFASRQFSHERKWFRLLNPEDAKAKCRRTGDTIDLTEPYLQREKDHCIL